MKNYLPKSFIWVLLSQTDSSDFGGISLEGEILNVTSVNETLL